MKRVEDLTKKKTEKQNYPQKFCWRNYSGHFGVSQIKRKYKRVYKFIAEEIERNNTGLFISDGTRISL